MSRSGIKWLSAAVLLLLFCLLCAVPACGETARDITDACAIMPGSAKKSFPACLDRDYTTHWQSMGGDGAAVEVFAPEGGSASGVWIQWYDHPHAASLQCADQNGAWSEVSFSEGLFLTDWLPLPEGTKRFRIVNRGKARNPLVMTELRIFGPGEVPPQVHRWAPPAIKADLMLLVAHPDDEVLWFGGLLPTYAGEERKICQICMLTNVTPYRRLELLDSLWTCGVRTYPVWGGYPDSFTSSLSVQYRRWDRLSLQRIVTRWIRRFKPDVLVTHDFKGEYGHGAHMACADAVTYALEYAANPKKFFSDSGKQYGVWDTPKCYIHLYGEAQIVMDWRKPLAAFGGKTGHEVAEEAFLCHVSQQNTEYHVEDSGPYDNRLFGLYRSTVGEDLHGDDLFENIGPVRDDGPDTQIL